MENPGLQLHNDIDQKSDIFRMPSTWWTCWRSRTFKERIQIILLIVAVIAVIGLAVGISIVNVKANSRSGTDAVSDKVCDLPSCNHAASEILKNMNTSVDPCDNFYKFACGGFMKPTFISDHSTKVYEPHMRYDSFSAGEDVILNQLRRSIENLISTNIPYAFRLVKTLYKSCMDKPVIEEQGLTHLLSIIKKLGGWPVLEGDTWNDHESDWTTIVFKLRELGYDSNNLIDFSINVDPKNSSKRVIYLDDPIHDERRFPLILGFRENISKEYYRYMFDTAVILGAERKRAQYELMDAFEFERKLAQMSMSEIWRENNATSMYNPITVAELLNNHSSIPWKEYFNRFLAPYYKFDDIDVVMVRSPYFFSDFEQLIKSTPKRVQANYLIWHTVVSSVKYLNDGIRERQIKYNKYLYGETEGRPRWKECVETVSNTLPISTGAMYVRDYFSKDARETARKITLDVRDQFIKTLQTVDWMNEETRKHALDKAESITINIGYPDEFLNDTKLDEFYGSLKLDENASYLENTLTSLLYETEYTISELKNPVNKSDWVRFDKVVNVDAYISLLGNSFYFPVGILQGNLFNKDLPKYLNYGGIGFIVGHEIIHGFDDQGNQYDKNGNLAGWWDPSTNEKYIDKVLDLITLYKIYGSKASMTYYSEFYCYRENTADNEGIKLAYSAYRDWADQHEAEPKLPGLPYSPKQMFWINAAKTWCSGYRPELASLITLFSMKFPIEYRVDGPLSNSPDFAKDFNCPLDSNMNPQEKFSVW